MNSKRYQITLDDTHVQFFTKVNADSAAERELHITQKCDVWLLNNRLGWIVWFGLIDLIEYIGVTKKIIT